MEENSSAELLFQRKNRINVKKKIKRAGWKGSEAFLPSPLNIRVCRGAEGREKREEGGRLNNAERRSTKAMNNA